MQTRMTLYPNPLAGSLRTVGSSALEDIAFPFEDLSEIAELESWRKEINRPIYHIHKWWAQRLGSVFRAILIGALTVEPHRVMERFYEPVRFPDVVIFDPFMGSGTTVGEALKLGMRAIGRDINPVAHFAVKNALAVASREEVRDVFRALEQDTAEAIRKFYRVRIDDDIDAEALYYFWVKVVDCPSCQNLVDLFSSYIFARHAYPSRYPEAKAICPSCGDINVVRYDASDVMCVGCGGAFDVSHGPVRGANATCPHCLEPFPIIQAFRLKNEAPRHRLYAKLVLMPDGTKQYLSSDSNDDVMYREASNALQARLDAYPVVSIEAGHNTNQVLNYGYRFWHEMFNDRQLLGLSLLSERISAIENRPLKELFTCLLSSTLEFNNMFASYKGEGTGAVRHMFSHHILKPERTPLEANLWGTPKSSGAFSTLFRSRLMRALEYRDDPFEIRQVAAEGKKASEKIYGLSLPLRRSVAEHFEDFSAGNSVYLACGDSAKTDIPNESVDLVVTDPPFFDNVHYSELADFFYVWQRHILGEDNVGRAGTTRVVGEVQSKDPIVFSERLQGVFAEMNRVLRPDGLLVFSYHHSRAEGWAAILAAIIGSGFIITATQPVKSEMSSATPKQQARQPIDLDIIVVCRKRETCGMEMASASQSSDSVREVLDRATAQVRRFQARGRWLSRNDVRVVVMAQAVQTLSHQPSSAIARTVLTCWHDEIETAIGQMFIDQDAVVGVPRGSG